MGFLNKQVSNVTNFVSNPVKAVENLGNEVVTTVTQVLQDPKALAIIAINVYAPGAGLAIGQAMGLTGTMASFVGTAALNTAVNGGDIEAGAKAAALSIGGQAVANQVSQALADQAIPKALATTVGKATGAAAMAQLTGQDPILAIKNSGLSSGVDILASQIDGFSKLPVAAQNGAKIAIKGKLQGKDPAQIDQALLAGAITDGLNYIKNYSEPAPTPTTVAANKPTPQQIEAQVVKTPEEQINNLVQQTQGREATPEEVASLMGSMIQKEAVSPTLASPGVQVASSDPAFKVDMAGFAYTKESAPANIQPPTGMRFLTDAEVNADPKAQAVNAVDANGKSYSAFLAPSGITQPLAEAQVIEPDSNKVTHVDLTAPNVVSDYAPITADVAASGQGTTTSPLNSLASTKQDVLTAITGQPSQGALTSVQSPPDNMPVLDNVTATATQEKEPLIAPVSISAAPITAGTYGDPLKTTVDYGLGPATVNVPSPPANMDVLDEVVATATQEKEPILAPVSAPSTLSPLSQTVVDSRPVANVTASTPAPLNIPVSYPVSQRSNAAANQQSTTLNSSLDTTGKNPTGLPESFLTTTMTADKFESPLDAFRKLQTEQPVSSSANNQIMQQQQPMNDYYSYGQVPSMDDIFGFSSTAMPMMAEGGLAGTRHGKYAGGGMATPLMAAGGKMRVDFRHGDAVTGAGDGQSDDIPAMLADGEFVFPADVVAAIGNGSTKAGSDKLYDMMHGIRAHVRSAKPKDLPPQIKSPLQFLKTKPSMARR